MGPVAEPESGTGLKTAALSGARWTLAARVGMQLVTWPITILVMRLLEPGDYGLLALALLVSGFITLFSELGLGVALVQAPQLSDAQIRMACTLVLLLNGVIAFIIIALAPLMAAAFEEPDLTLVMRVLCLELLMSALAAVPLALLERGLKFKPVALGLMAGGISGSLVTLTAALLGAGVWALVAGTLATALVRSAAWITFHGRPVRPGRLRLQTIRPMVRVSSHAVALRVLWYWSGQADQLVLGRLLHTSALGLYSVASQLAMLPAGKAMDTVNRVAFPILSRLQSEPHQLQASHRNSTALLALYGFGVCWGLAAVAPEFVRLVMGEKWLQATLPLAVLSLIAPLRMLCAFNNTMVTAVGMPQLATRELMLGSVLIPAAVGFGAYADGLRGATLAWLMAYPLVYLYSTHLTAAAVRMPRLAALRVVAAPMAAGLCMLAAVWACRAALGETPALALRLGAGIVTGAATYLLVLWLVARPLLLGARGLSQELFRPGAGSQGAATPQAAAPATGQPP
jgi:teichuronic acid exporter